MIKKEKRKCRTICSLWRMSLSNSLIWETGFVLTFNYDPPMGHFSTFVEHLGPYIKRPLVILPSLSRFDPPNPIYQMPHHQCISQCSNHIIFNLIFWEFNYLWFDNPINRRCVQARCFGPLWLQIHVLHVTPKFMFNAKVQKMLQNDNVYTQWFRVSIISYGKSYLIGR